MSNVPRGRGRPSHEARAALTTRPTPLVRLPEGARFEFVGSPDDRAGVEHYWVRRFFYAALCSYAPAAHAELVQEIAHDEDQVGQVTDESRSTETQFSRFLNRVGEKLPKWCHRYHMLVGSEEAPNGGQVPNWLVADLTDSYIQWHPKQDPFPLSAFWRDRGTPVEIDDELVEAAPDSAELRALLRIDLVRAEVDESRATAPVVISASEAMKELVERFKAFVEPELRALFESAKERGIVKPSADTLDTAMRRYVLKQFRWLDSIEIAAMEDRGDPACNVEATDAERQDHEFSWQRRDVDEDIKFAGDLLGVPARSFPPGPKPKRSLAERRT